jgi:hypothetical protein
MLTRSSLVATLLLVAATVGTVLGLAAGVYGALHLGLALHGQYDYYLAGSPVGSAIIAGSAALGAFIPLGLRALWRKARAGAR